ncbi:MAG: LytTR family DNA-binding domain-containing protein [Bacteroidetes bacterium]|nr:LytTR family DNA-binding domain-containing protein [Bacteroidota bacterium]
MINAVIIDDEQNNIEGLQSLLGQFCPSVTICGTATNAKDGITCIKEESPQLVFLDIEMPFGNAFTLLEKLMPVDFEVIFVTAFEQYALKAIKYVALDYILKPVNIDELRAAVEKMIKKVKERDYNRQIAALIENLKPDNKHIQKIGLHTLDGIQFEDMNKIIRMEAEGRYTKVFFQNKTHLIACRQIKDFEDMLPDTIFFRIHNSHIININFLKKYFKGRGGYVEMSDGTTLQVSTRKKDLFLEKFIH